jgi:predicted transcriptional regulator
MHEGRRARGDLAQQVLAVLAAADRPLTAGEVRQSLDPSLAHNTVLTVLTRLCDKGEVTREAAGRGHLYRGVTDHAAVTAWRMQQLLTAEDDRAAVLARFHDTLSPEDAAVLAVLLSADRQGES